MKKGMKTKAELDRIQTLTEELEIHRKETEKLLFQTVYNWGRVGIVTDETCPTFQKLLSTIKMIG